MLNSEFSRKLPSVSYVQNQPQSIRLPTDSALKRINIRLSGSFSVTYASGSPVADVTGIFNRICPLIEVVVDGQDTVKSASPFAFQQLQFLLQGILGERRYSTSSGAPTTAIGTTDGGLAAFPATTYYVTNNEQVTISFEDRWAYAFGSDVTVLNLKRSTNPELRFKFSSFGNIQDANSSSVAVTYAANTLQFDVTTVEAQDVSVNDFFYTFKEYQLTKQFSAQSQGSVLELNTGNALQGILFLVRNGDATRTMSNVALTNISLRLNGQSVIKETTFLELRAENLGRIGIQAPTAGGVGRMDGTAYMSLIKNGDIRNAIDLSREAGVYQAQLLLTTAAASGNDAATYTNPVEVIVLVQEIVTPAELRKKAA